MAEDIAERIKRLEAGSCLIKEVVEVTTEAQKELVGGSWNSYTVQSHGKYRVGNRIQFWHQAEHCWIEGTIAYIQLINGFLVCLHIDYNRWKKKYREKIYRKDWLDDAVVSAKTDI